MGSTNEEFVFSGLFGVLCNWNLWLHRMGRVQNSPPSGNSLDESRKTGSILKIKRVTVHLDDSGPDYIYMTPDIETPFPILGYEPAMKMDAQVGFGIEWVRKTFCREPDEVIDLRRKKDTRNS